ncbi:MAG: hypothetical protein M3373_02180 [Gemmatimonadota bacterium]|nr:hypothetical protein [Gemmatimonadota bacterium]
MRKTIIAVLLTLTACSSGERSAADTGAAPDPAAVAPSAEGTNVPSDAAAVVHAVLTGGNDAGTYDVQAQDALCSTGADGVNSWQARHTDFTATSGLSNVRVIIPDTVKAIAGSAEFHLALVVGPVMQGNDYVIETRPDIPRRYGRGTAKVEDAGATARITVQGLTHDSVEVDVVIQCNRVERTR